jgi:thiamine biosynthesis protein ThiI
METVGTADTGEPKIRQRILVRYSGDVTTKARATRRRFVRCLARNLRDALGPAGPRAHLKTTRDRIVIELPEPIDPTPLSHVYGAQSIAVAERRAWSDLGDLVEAGRQLFESAVAGKRFAVRARRVGDRMQIPLLGRELECALGEVLARGAAGVDLSHPEVTAHVEIHAGEAYFYRRQIPGPGGLPLGVEGNAVALVSGGFDSLVATWLMSKRGIDIDYVFCNLGGRAHQLEAIRVMDVLAREWSHGGRPHLHAIDFDAVTRDLQAHVAQRYWQVVLKRRMLIAAEQVARERGAMAIITGDAVGQVSSQTLRNIATISSAASIPVLRPLVGFNKDEILAIARDIGTYELSKQVGEYCAMVPSKPATAASIAAVEREEEKLDLELLTRAVAERSVLDLRALDLGALETPGLDTSAVDEAATVLDLRSKPAYQAWHYPGALFLDFANALRTYPSMPKQGRYLLYCEFGLKSAHLAELMRGAGFDAAHFKHGVAELQSYARKRDQPAPGP